MGVRISGSRKSILPLPLRAWAAKRTKVGGRGRSEARTDQPLPPTLVRFAAQALKGRGSALEIQIHPAYATLVRRSRRRS